MIYLMMDLFFKKREITTTNQVVHSIPNLNLIRTEVLPTQIIKDNLTNLLRNPREINCPRNGFGAKLPSHPTYYDQRFDNEDPLKQQIKNIMG